jgi:UrcA family protein
MIMKIAMSCTLFVVLMGSLNAVAAAGEWDNGPPKRVVHFADLDLTRSAGVAVLYARIRFAAREVCEPVEDRALRSILARSHCVTQAIARAVADVNVPTLTSYHLTKTGQTITLAEQR